MLRKIYYLISFFILGEGIILSQNKGVGINTNEPSATLDIKEIPIAHLPNGYSQGVIFPSFTTEERSTFKNVKIGTMLYNTTLKCLEIYTIKNSKEGWYCMGNVAKKQLDTRNITLQEIRNKQKLMFQDSEPNEILFSDKRGFYLQEMLQVRKVDGNKIRIRNFIPYTFRDVSVFYKIPNIEKALEVIRIEEIGPLVELEFESVFDKRNLYFSDEDGGVINIDREKLENNSTINLNVKNDDLFNKISSIKHQTFISFYNYASGNWGVTSSKYIREYLPILVNFAYLYSSEKFKEAFINFPFELYDNNKKEINRLVVYKNFFNVKRKNIGVTAKVEGLGGGRVFGVHTRFLEQDLYYKTNEKWPVEVWAHELGHVLGYSHNSNMTYKDSSSGYGYVNIVIELYREMLENGELPFITNPYK